MSFFSSVWRFFFPRRTLSTHTKSLLQREIKKIRSRHPRDRIIQLDIILHRIAHSYRYTGTVGEILKQKPYFLSTSLQEIWQYHKIRNQLVHELDHPHDRELEQVADRYEQILLQILK